MSIFSTIIIYLPNILFSLAVILFVIYFLLKKQKTELWLILIGKLIQLIGTGIGILTRVKFAQNTVTEVAWMTSTQSGVYIIGGLIFTIGLLILLSRYLQLLQKESS